MTALAYRHSGNPAISGGFLRDVSAGSYRMYVQNRIEARWEYAHNVRMDAFNARLRLRQGLSDSSDFVHVVEHEVGVVNERQIVDATMAQLHLDTVLLVSTSFRAPSEIV